MKINFYYITETSKNTDGMTIRQCAQFHYFNKNGILFEKSEYDKKISEQVASGILNSGAILVYGSFNTYHSDKLIEVSRGKKISRHGLNYILNAIREDIEKAKVVLK